jgi:hypothetical protein
LREAQSYQKIAAPWKGWPEGGGHADERHYEAV